MLTLLTLLFSAGFFCFAAGNSLSSAGDLEALYSLRSSLALRAREWPLRADPCSSWAGIACDSDGRVVSLHLSGLRRTRIGRRNPRFSIEGIQNLTRLASFNASGFTLVGSIPDWFGRLPQSLAVIDLSRASIYGEIPYSLGEASGLKVLSLAKNSITGDIPSTLGELKNLLFLDLSMNALSGDVPADFIAGIREISYLDLSSNFLSGAVLREIGGLSKLKTLILANNSFSGSIPPELGKASSLVTLDLSFNSLFGALPVALTKLKNLQNLNLGSNFLSGLLRPNALSGLSLLESISLDRNNFYGELPESLRSLPKLRFLDVSHNNFTGTLPELSLTNASARSGGSINLSHNLLYGSIPSGFAAIISALSYMDFSDNYLEGFVPRDRKLRLTSFKSNCFQNTSSQRTQAACENFYEERGLPFEGLVNKNGSSSDYSKRKSKWKYIVAAIVGGTSLLVLVLVSVMLCFRHYRSYSAKQREAVQPTAATFSLPTVGMAFTYQQVTLAASGFSEVNLIKKGRSGDLYRGVLENGMRVVVKRINVSIAKESSYMEELDLFAKLGSHERFVPFLGYCLEKEDEKFLVYKQMPYGDINSALYRKSGAEEDGLQSLDWITRLKIATGIAEALCFMHHECSPPLVHRDIQASSILLDDKYEVRLGSLSRACAQEGDGHPNAFSRFLRRSQKPEQSTSGDAAPAWCSHDVYCMGEVLLELVTGARGGARTSEWVERTLRWVSVRERHLVARVVDPSLIVDEDLMEEVWAVAVVARSCLNPRPSRRPPAKSVLKALENPLDLLRDDGRSAAGDGASSFRASSKDVFPEPPLDFEV